MADKKRVRNPNFSSKEKRTLLECAFDEKNIIENKKTDGVTWKEKEAAWERITANFNCHSDSACYRTAEALKKFYQSYKKEIRKVAADEKMSRSQTGGGKPEHVDDENFDLAIAIMNKKTITGFENIFDGDGAEYLEDEADMITNINEERPKETTSDWGKYKPTQLRNPVHPKLKTTQAHISDEQEATSFENIDENPVIKTNIPMSKGFQKQFTSTKENESKWCGRRRPVASTLPSTKITEQYSQLSAIKIELAKLQYDTQKEEAIQKKYSSSIEHELRKRSLELDIEIKTEVLKKVKSDSFTIFEACNVLKDLGNLNP